MLSVVLYLLSGYFVGKKNKKNARDSSSMRRGFCKLYMFNVQPVSPSASNWDVLVRQGVMSKGCCWKDGWYVSYVSGSVKKKKCKGFVL